MQYQWNDEKWRNTPFRQVHTHTHTYTQIVIDSLNAAMLPKCNTQPDMRGVDFGHFGLNIADLQLLAYVVV